VEDELTEVPSEPVRCKATLPSSDDYEFAPVRRREFVEQPSAGAAAHSLGIASLVLGVVGLVLALIPCVGMIALPLAAVGLLLGVVGGGVAIARGGRGIGFPIAGSATNLLALAVGGVWLLLSVGTVGHLASVPVAAPDSRPTHECSFGEEMRFGDLGVAVRRARVEGFTSVTPAGRQLFHQPAFVITIGLKNYNPNRVIDAGAQVDAARLEDDVGNRYDGIKAVNEIGLAGRIEGQIPPGMARPVRSDEDARDVLVFDRPVPGASTLTLTLDASRYGGLGRLKVQIPRSAWGN
jgi:hypothetical protein